MEWMAAVEACRPVPVRIMSWLEQRYAETGNGAYAIAGLQAAKARGRIEEPWLLAWLDWTDAAMSGALRRRRRGPNESLGDALAKIMRLNKGKGKDPLEEAILDIRDHRLYFAYEETLLANGGREKDAVSAVASHHGLGVNNVTDIIARIASTRAPPLK
jgi:hypothetical protein